MPVEAGRPDHLLGVPGVQSAQEVGLAERVRGSVRDSELVEGCKFGLLLDLYAGEVESSGERVQIHGVQSYSAPVIRDGVCMGIPDGAEGDCSRAEV